MRDLDVRIVSSSEDSIQIQFLQKICEEVNAQVRAFVESFKDLVEPDSMTCEPPGAGHDSSKAYGKACAEFGIIEIVPTYCAVTVYFDPLKTDADSVTKIACKALDCANGRLGQNVAAGKLVEIPVCYEDSEFAPDLADVAEHTGLSMEEVIRRHHSRDYLIYMLGFLPGFPYLGGMDEQLETPRLETPRTKIPAGSVAIGGKQAGLYPSDSPGGWRIIGRTPLKVFDAERSPACLYEAGDRIRFVPITRAQFDEIAAREGASCDSSAPEAASTTASHQVVAAKPRYVCTSGIKILDAGMCTTVQDKGRFGFEHLGIGQSGVMDAESFSLGNAIAGNTDNAACLEATVLGPSIEFTLPCEFVITGGICNAALDDNLIEMNKKYQTHEGSVLKCGFIKKGLRSYICFKGGLLVPEVFGSRSTNLKSKTGGYYGRKLEAGDQIAVGFCAGETGMHMSALDIESGVLVLNCTRGSQFSDFSSDAVKKFENGIFTVLPQSDRMGIRFSGESLDCGKTDIISDAIPFGAVQITSAGLPVVMAADRQTTGGYAKIACVTRHSMCLLAQAVPGTKVRFKII